MFLQTILRKLTEYSVAKAMLIQLKSVNNP